MNLLRALAYRQKSLRRRLGPRLAVAPLVLLAVLGALVAGLFALGRHLAGATPPTPESVANTAFWFGILQALIYCYTTFEVIFRAPDARFLNALPIRGSRRFDELMVVALVVHLPLLLPAAAFALAIADHGLPELGAFAFSYAALSWLIGIPIAMWLHLLAGRSLLSQSSQLKKMMAGAVIADEAALLIYAPALGLLVIAVAGIFLELTLRQAFVRGDAGTVAALFGGGVIVVGVAWRTARQIAELGLHRMLPRFAEADVPPPFHDDGVARHLPGAAFARWLPQRSRAFFMRDLKQLRRRYRLDRLLLWASPVLAWRVAADSPGGSDGVVVVLGAFGAVMVLVFTSGFRLVGRELGAPALDRALPFDRRAANLGRFAASALHPLQAAIGFGLGAAFGGLGVASLWVVSGAVVGALGWTGLVMVVAQRLERDFVGASSLALRGAAIAALAWSGGW